MTATARRTSPTDATDWTAHRPPAIRSTLDDVQAVPAALRSEWIKLASLRSNRAVLGLNLIVSGLVAWACATFVTDEVITVSQVFIYATVLTAAIAAITGILQFAAEAEHGTLAGALTAQPARWVLVTAKTVMAASRGFVLGATGMAAGFAGAVIGGLDMGDTSGMARTALWAVLYTSLSAVLGLGVGMIVRHSAAAISGLLMWSLVVENLLRSFAPATAARFLPFNAGNALLAIKATTDTAETVAVAFTRAENAMLFTGYTAAALLLGTVLLYRRDTN
jgi:ABC-2 type transport system permease protein